MRTVTVNKNDLLAVVKENREKHRNIFLEAQRGYRREFIKLLEQRLEEARDGRKIDQRIRLTEPMDQTRDYDRVISMLEMSVDEEIDLTQDEYAAYVMDDWSWKHQFLASNSTYTAIE